MWNVLVVDDSATSRALLEHIVVRLGHRPLLADCGARALALCEVERPDIMLLDVMMPDIDGWELAVQLRAIERLRCVPIVFQSSIEKQAEIDRCLACGAAAILNKPVRMARVAAILESLLGAATQPAPRCDAPAPLMQTLRPNGFSVPAFAA